MFYPRYLNGKGLPLPTRLCSKGRGYGSECDDKERPDRDRIGESGRVTVERVFRRVS